MGLEYLYRDPAWLLDKDPDMFNISGQHCERLYCMTPYVVIATEAERLRWDGITLTPDRTLPGEYLDLMIEYMARAERSRRVHVPFPFVWQAQQLCEAMG